MRFKQQCGLHLQVNQAKDRQAMLHFSNSGCLQRIAKIMLKVEDFNPDALLLKYNLNHVNHKFKKLNDYPGFSKSRQA